jgi:hypothetical protein
MVPLAAVSLWPESQTHSVRAQRSEASDCFGTVYVSSHSFSSPITAALHRVTSVTQSLTVAPRTGDAQHMPEILFLPVSRVLTPLEIQLFSYLGNERQSVELAKVIGSLPENADHSVIEQAIAKALVAALETKNGVARVEYVRGVRLDRWRETQ